MRPRLVVNVQPNGRSNWSGLMATLARTLKPGQSDRERVISFSEIRMAGGTIVVTDEERGVSEELSDVELSFAWPSISRSFGASGRFVWRDEIPLLEGALTHLVCTVVDSHTAGDHTLYVGRVEHLEYSNGSPLVFYTGEYGRLDVQLWDHSYIWKPDPWT